MFIINGYVLTIIGNSLVYIATSIMIGYNYSLFFVIAVVVIIINAFILYVYHRAER